MTYSVKEIFYTLQGEGAQSGRAAVFCRFAGCNLWSGLEGDRLSALCQFCDTDFVGTDGKRGGKYENARDLVDALEEVWNLSCPSNSSKYAVLTGGEPGLQVDISLVEALHISGYEVGIETNGTQKLPNGIDWICVSPKEGAELVLATGDELKVVFPQGGLDISKLEQLDFRHYFVQPKDCAEKDENIQKAIEFCMNNPVWRLSLQTHKIVGLP